MGDEMTTVDLRALQSGDGDAWDEAFRWLWPTVFAVAQLTLQPYFPNEVEDVAIEALEELVEKVRVVAAPEELKPLAASIAHHRAVSLLRERFAKKRGQGKTESLDMPADDAGETKQDPVTLDSPLTNLEQKELAERLGQSREPELKAELERLQAGVRAAKRRAAAGECDAGNSG